MSYNSDRPRKKGTPPRKKKEKENYRSNLREVSVRYDNNSSPSKQTKIEPTLQSIWPSIVEYVGLSEYESKIYLGLITIGTSGARRLSLHCDVPRTKVYGTLKKLIEYGLVIEIPGSPKKFIATNPRVAFSTLLELQKMQAEDFSKLMKKMGEKYEERINEREPDIIYSWYLDDGEKILDKCVEFIRNTNKVLTIMTNADGLEAIFNNAGNELDDLAGQDTVVKIFCPLDQDTNTLSRELGYMHEVIRRDVSSDMFLLNSDNSRYVIAKTLPREEGEVFDYCIFGESPETVSIIDLLISSDGEGPIRVPIMSL